MRISIFIDLAAQQVSIETESDLGEATREEFAVDTTSADGPEADGAVELIVLGSVAVFVVILAWKHRHGGGDGSGGGGYSDDGGNSHGGGDGGGDGGGGDGD